MWNTFWDFLWTTLVIFAFIAYLMILFNILVDLFWRDHKTSGWVKAIWVIFLIVLPYLTALVYLIARGRGMGERSMKEAEQIKQAQDAYIQSVAGSGAKHSPAEEIARAKSLLDAGTISQAEYDQLKAKALG